MTQARSRQSWFSKEGSAFPLGAIWLPDEKAYNFALYSKHATRVTLLLFGDDETTAPLVEVELNHKINKSGRIWHCRLARDEMRGARYYAYSIDGPPGGNAYDLHTFDADKVLLDPYARQVYFPDSFDLGFSD